jgi:hypothetical protein
LAVRGARDSRIFSVPGAKAAKSTLEGCEPSAFPLHAPGRALAVRTPQMHWKEIETCVQSEDCCGGPTAG